MDERVKDVQVWLNKTYGNVSGFKKAPEDGRTGWDTIYSLREGLQYELGVSPLAEGFGDMTRSALSSVIGSLTPGYSGNIIKLVKGAFWCKGISPVDFNSKFNTNLSNAIEELQNDAGIEADGQLSVNLMAALFDMSAFVLIPGRGVSGVREMQQYLNSRYSDELGILPCDGIYQRATNTALIFALQKVIGVAGANGNYGPGTIAATPTVQEGASGDIVRIIQYGLYVNGFYDGSFDGKFDGTVADSIIKFRKFMNLPPFTSTADLTVIKGLLTSNGNTNRDSIALDTSTQVSTQDLANFKRYGFSVMGRYLTGSVGVGSSKRDKDLTAAEIKRIEDSGMSVFPIYEDGGYEIDYFNKKQGYKDGIIAAVKASELGFPKGTTIYFAVDFDIQDGDIEGTVEPYMNGIITALKYTDFEPGIYGTRNVCLHGEKLGMKNSFVADMSYGWSGNLGFVMPKNWAFDQFVEYSIGGTPIDQVAASGRDKGTKSFSPRKQETISPSDTLKEIIKSLKQDIQIDLSGEEVTILETPTVEVTLSASDEFAGSGDSPIFTINNGKLNSVDITNWLKKKYNMENNSLSVAVDELQKFTVSAGITNGDISISVSQTNGTDYKLSISCNVYKEDNKLVTNTFSIEFGITMKPTDFFHSLPNGDAIKITLGVVLIALIVALVTLITGGAGSSIAGEVAEVVSTLI
ncbi:peptidoglycan hydrolase-like protein with peptidoglycan-binding domain [Lactobacillus colini]|uniref:Peptidoglycan hydrolase-like protein with peptidoglycan-binding domain n=1 Tax=Lactobacillus colini TaxID=1819254 RepID=A0ABS4MCK9_9LACO|nr:glycoside hydrolase domain-containing protein [Lactobacillus colini]MBP2057343.1 peptidoglycan hydrolase-like protein with peptidoglycan-binding domain [Lactobacillus colini]